MAGTASPQKQPESRWLEVGGAIARCVQDNTALIVVAVGYMLAQFPFNWALAIAESQTMLTRPFEPNAIIDIGEVLGFALAMALGSSRGRKRPLSPVFTALIAASGVGAIFISLCAVAPSAVLAYAGDVLMGAGYALTFALWLTCASLLSPHKMLIVLAAGYLFNFVSYPSIVDVPLAASAGYALAAMAGSLILWLAAMALLRLEGPGTPARPAPYRMPIRLIAFAMVIPFTYGFCTSFLGIGATSLGLKIGFALAAAAIVAGLIAGRGSFSLSTVYGITCPLMILGLACSFFLDMQPMLSKACISTALASANIITYMVIRVQSQLEGRSPLSTYGLAGLLMMAATKTGKEAEPLFTGTVVDTYIVIALIIGVALVSGAVIAGSQGKSSFDLRTLLSAENSRERILMLAEEHGLSKRETTVYALLIEDKTAAEIAEELFIAPSTARAHVSRIYDKFGVHNRQELMRKVN